MQAMNTHTPSSKTSRAKGNPERGVALIVTLILLALLSAASLAMVLTVSSDTLINGYYRNYRGSFYAADSGINVVVESMKNAIQNAANTANNPPLPIGATTIPTAAQTWASTTTLPASFSSSYTPYQGSYYSIGDTGAWNGQFELITATPVGSAQFELQPNPHDANSCLPITLVTCANGNANDQDYVWTYSYPFTVTVQGLSSGSEAEQITETGVITYSSDNGTSASAPPPSFSKWGAFITNFSDCQGPLVPGTETGPFFTDGQWNFGNYSNPGYTFTNTVGQAGANVSWWNNNNCSDSSTTPHGFNAPNFEGGLKLNQNAVTPPTDSYNQEQAVLDGKGIPPCTSTPCPTDNPPSQSQMSAELSKLSGSSSTTSYPSSGTPTSGVYFPYQTTGTNMQGQTCTTTTPCYGSWNSTSSTAGAGGGFLIQGNASITLSATTTTVGSNQYSTQTYTITQGSTTTTIVVNNGNNTTTVTSGSNSQILQGVPEQLNPNTGAQMTMNGTSTGDAVSPTLIYVNGQITGLSGTVQNNTGITVAASSDVSITGDLTYSSQPISVPADTLNSSTNAGVLGVYTNGNINLYPNSSGSNRGNLTVDASLAAIGGSTGNAGFETPGNSIGTWTIIGGRSEDHAHSVSISTGNTYYDLRLANNFGPPWFPTAVPQAGQVAIAPSAPTLTVVRTSWTENNRI